MLRINTKRGDGLSLNVIILAVIALLVLVILSYMVLSNTGKFNKGVNSCGANADCVADKSACNQPGYIAIPANCNTNGNSGASGYCCTPLTA